MLADCRRVGHDNYHTEDQQLRETTACAERRHLEIVDTIVDRDKSDGDLTRLEPLVERIENGEADVLVVYKTSRFARSSRAYGQIVLRLLECGGDLVAAQEDYDIYALQGRMIL